MVKFLFIFLVFVIQGFSENSCAFCNDEILKKQVFYEDEHVIALYTHKPILEGHCLIIPKRHVERFEDLSEEEYIDICKTIKKVNLVISELFNTPSYLVLQKNGVEVGQTVPHVHFHYIPRKEGECSAVKFMAKMLIAAYLSPLNADQMKEITQKIKQCFNDKEEALL